VRKREREKERKREREKERWNMFNYENAFDKQSKSYSNQKL